MSLSGAPAQQHRIEIAQGGPAFDCGADEFILTAAERAGWTLPASCRAGICGTCEGGIDSGCFVLPGRNGDGELLAGPAAHVKLCRVKPRSDLRVVARDVRRADPAAARVLAAKVLKIEKAASEVAVLKLRFPAGTRAKFLAGQYLKVQLPNGDERSFSMANAPHVNDGVELHVRYLPGGQFAESVFNVLNPGDVVRLRLPFGDFHLRDTQAPIVFVAGGTGFAPVQSMVEDVMRRRVDRPMRLYFGGRTPELLYRDALARGWAAKWPALRYVPVVSQPSPGDGWSGRTGFVHDAVIADLPTLAGHEVYACGSPAMIASAREAFERHGLAPADFFCDAFAPAMELAA